MQNKLSSIASYNSIAATDESTPPDKPKITFLFPIFFFKLFIVDLINESGVHDCEQSQISTIKFFSKTLPSVV